MKSNTSRNLTSGSSGDINTEGMLSINIKRLEEKCRLRENKIDELKQNIFVLEESLMKLKKKEV